MLKATLSLMKRLGWTIWISFLLLGCCFYDDNCDFAVVAEMHEPTEVVVPIEHLGLTPANEVQFIQGYFPGEGYIDLGELVFSTNANYTSPTTHLDVAVVRVPTHVCPDAPPTMADMAVTCPKSTWMEHTGIGARMGGGWWWCCNQKVIGTCPAASTPKEHESSSSSSGNSNNNNQAYLMVNEKVMDGTLHHLDLPPVANTTIPVQDSQFFADEKGGYFVILMANCDTMRGQAVDVNGTVRFVSLEEALEEILKEEVPFYAWASLAYIVLFFWFAHLMHVNKESRIRLEEWIFGTLAVAMAEVLLHGVEYLLWSRTGHRNAFLALIAAIAFGFKHGVFRGLLVYLCSGVGVTCAALEPVANRTLIILTTAYVALSTALYYLIFIEQRQASSIESAYDTSFLAQMEGNIILTMMIIDLIFLVWIPKALKRTIEHLRLTNQERKLERFRWLVRVLIAAITVTFLLIGLVLVNATDALDLSKANEINVFVILTLISVLWRPNPMAREYCYVMEAPTEENDLELVENSERSASESSDTNYASFPVESAEAT